MLDFFKSVWVLLFIVMLLGLLMSTPVEKTKQEYDKEISKIQTEPQRRVDATYRYVEAIENGSEDLSRGLKMVPPRKYYIDNEDEEFYNFINYHQAKSSYVPYAQTNRVMEKKLKPRYRRDKNNPKILYPVHR